jgi:hypothetical protein
LKKEQEYKTRVEELDRRAQSLSKREDEANALLAKMAEREAEATLAQLEEHFTCPLCVMDFIFLRDGNRPLQLCLSILNFLDATKFSLTPILLTLDHVVIPSARSVSSSGSSLAVTISVEGGTNRSTARFAAVFL